MKINIYGSTGIIGTKTLFLIFKYFPKLKVNLLSANNNVSKLIKQTELFSPNFVHINNPSKIKILKKHIKPHIKILDSIELKVYLKETKSDYSLLAISGYKSLNYFDLILKNTATLGLVSKEAVVSAGHLFKKYTNILQKKIFPIDSEHFSIFNFLKYNKSMNFNKLTLTASGGPFLGIRHSSLKNVSFKEASSHPKWKMGYKNSIDSATLSNKCLEIIEAHYLFNIPYNKLDIIIHPQSKIHSIFQFPNNIYNMVAFQNDMKIPIFHFLNQKNNFQISDKTFELSKNDNYSFSDVKLNQFPIFKVFQQLDKTNPLNIINFNVGNEFAVNLFKKNIINYTDIYKIIIKIVSLNLNYKLNNINDILNYHEILEKKINEKNILNI
jgi:1-deoxy-D-xylulose-5-phosphate reductoisomerase